MERKVSTYKTVCKARQIADRHVVVYIKYASHARSVRLHEHSSGLACAFYHVFVYALGTSECFRLALRQSPLTIRTAMMSLIRCVMFDSLSWLGEIVLCACSVFLCECSGHTVSLLASKQAPRLPMSSSFH